MAKARNIRSTEFTTSAVSLRRYDLMTKWQWLNKKWVDHCFIKFWRPTVHQQFRTTIAARNSIKRNQFDNQIEREKRRTLLTMPSRKQLEKRTTRRRLEEDARPVSGRSAEIIKWITCRLDGTDKSRFVFVVFFFIVQTFA